MNTLVSRRLAQMQEFSEMLKELGDRAVGGKKIPSAVVIDVLLFTALGSMARNGVSKEEAIVQLSEMWDIAKELKVGSSIGLNQGDA